MCRETCCMTRHQENTPKNQVKISYSAQRSWIMQRRLCFLKREVFAKLVRCFTFLKIMNEWSRWSSRAEVRNWVTCPKIQIIHVDTKNQLTGHIDQGQFHSWWMESSSTVCSTSTSQCFHLANKLSSNHVEKADTGRNTRRRWARGCKIKTGAESSVDESQSVSKFAEFAHISKLGESYRKMFNLGFIRYGEARSDGFEWWQSIRLSSVAIRWKSELQHGDTRWFLSQLRIMFADLLGRFFWAWIIEEMVRNSHVQTEWKMGSCRWRPQCSTSVNADIPYSVDPVFRNEEVWKAREKEIMCSFLWWRRHRRIDSSHNVSIEQCRTCATNWLAESLVVQKVQRNLLLKSIQKTVVVPTQLSTANKTSRTNDKVQGDLLHEGRTKNGQIFQIIFSWSNCAPM